MPKKIFISESLFDENRKPIGFHGSPHDFSFFDDRRLGQGNDELGPGHYLFDNPEDAFGYSEGGYVYKCKLHLEQIMSTNAITFTDDEITAMLDEVQSYDEEYAFTDWAKDSQMGKEIYFDHLRTDKSDDHDLFTSIIYDNGLSGDELHRFLSFVTGDIGIDGAVLDWHGNTVYVVLTGGSIEILDRYTQEDYGKIVKHDIH